LLPRIAASSLAVVAPFLPLLLMLIHSDGKLVVKGVNVSDSLLDYLHL